MFDTLFKGIFDTDMTTVISVSDFILCILISQITGIIIAISHMYRSHFTKSFIVTLALLPTVVCVVIMMVNGNVGTGVAVAGAFSLVRFRSAAGTAKEITMLFLAMSSGLIAGMGYLGFSVLFTVIMCLLYVLYNNLDYGFSKINSLYKTLTITIPENLDYSDVFDPILKKYTSHYELVKVKTTNMGSLYRLTYDLTLRSTAKEKEMIDKLRCRNGNLEITVSKQDNSASEL